MTSARCREARQSLGVYVLGAIGPAERAQVEEHLATCPECREELAGLAGLPALLRRVPVAEAERLVDPEPAAAPGERLLRSLLERATRVRRARRWRGLAAAAAVVLVAVGGGAAADSALQPAASPPSRHVPHSWQTATTTNSVSGARITVQYAAIPPWGTVMNIRVSGIEAGTLCRLEVTNAAGQRMTVGWWRLSYYNGQPAWYRASTTLGGTDLRSVEIASGSRLLAEVPVS